MTDSHPNKAPSVLRLAPSAPPRYAWTGPRPDAGVLQQSTLSPQELMPLVEEFSQILEAGVHGLCFSPYLEGQAPGSIVSEDQIRARLEIVRPYTRWIRSFSCTEGHQHTPRIAHELGLKTLVGAWPSR
jgi:exo-beta-1,3-glucanase (GH17 family)